jgi:hypothetical protein
VKIYTKESLIEALHDIRDMGWIKSRRPGNDGAVGNTLEDLLGIAENNLPIPNAAEWEIKAQRDNTTSLTSLFHMEPSPRALKFIPKILLPIYGWRHQNAGTRYPESEMSFRQTICAGRFSDRGFSVEVDRQDGKVVVVFDRNKVSSDQSSWFNEVIARGGGRIEHNPYWGFKDLYHKAGTKLKNCFFIKAESRKEDGSEYFRFKDFLMLKDLSLENFINAIESGDVYIDFDARTGHNHGTKFRIREKKIPDLYSESLII